MTPVKEWTPRQQKAHRKTLVKALRSGEYEQAQKSLRTGGGFCCLGVACDVSGLGRWEGSTYIVGEHSSNIDLSEPVRKWLGFASDGGSYSDRRYSLIEWNDHGKPFSYIAGIIEREPAGLIEERAPE